MDFNKILLVDDEEDNVRVLSISLRADGYEVVTANSGEEGVQVFQAEKPDVILTDINMPGMDGIAVLRKIKAIDPDREVIIITGHGDVDNAIEALKYGASDFINKPIRDEALSIALKRAREKLEIKKKLREYTDKLEAEVEAATLELRRQSNFLKKLIRSSTDGIIATDKDFSIVVFNPGAENLLGYDCSDVISKFRLSDLLPPDITARLQNRAQTHSAPEEIKWRETNVRAKNGTDIPVRLSASVLYEKSVMMGSVVFLQDLREIKRLERELLQSERLATIGQTVAGLAHSIKNILHGFEGGSYLVDLGIAKNEPAKLKSGWRMIKKNIGRTSDLVLDLLSYSKQRDPEPEVCSPNEIAMDVVELLKERARENRVELSHTLDAKIGKVSVDPRTIHEALLNLVSNAIDACVFDGETHKKWHVRLITRKDDGGYLLLEVQDNGVGMNPEVQRKVFSSFFSTKGHHGTGLGLLVTRKLVEEHNGKIDFTSTEGQGTTFTVRLPYEEIAVQ